MKEWRERGWNDGEGKGEHEKREQGERECSESPCFKKIKQMPQK